MILLDAADVFEELDRARLQWDFAHLHDEGYELLAEVMLEELREAGAIRAKASPQRETLLAAYRPSASVASGPSR